mgnify:CR=1 FL=1
MTSYFSPKPQLSPKIYAFSDSHDQYKGLLKIGYTTKTVEERIKEHQTGNPRDIVCVFALKTEAPFLVEQSLHRLHSSDRIRLEWFEFKEEKELENLIDEAKKLDATFSPKIKCSLKKTD